MGTISHLCLLVVISATKVQSSNSYDGYQDFPGPVETFTCFLSNWQSNLTCKYRLPEGYSSDTIGIVTFYNSDVNSDPKLCYNGTDRHFRVYTSAVLDNFTFQVKLVDVRKNITSLSEEFRYNSDDAYLPGKIRNLTVTDVTSSYVTLVWSPPDYVEAYTYVVMYSAYWSEEETSALRLQTNSTQFVLPDLVPATRYEIQVLCRAFKYQPESDEERKLIGHWSAPELIWATTKDDVPGAAPRLAPAVSRPSATEIIVYWQPLSHRQRGGTLVGYTVTWGNADTQKRKLRVRASQTSITLTIPVSPRHVGVYAVNKVGASPTGAILVTPVTQEPSTPTFWASGDDGNSNITYHWNKMVTKGAMCYVFWCIRSPGDASCQNPIQWASVACDLQKITVNTTADSVQRLMVGLSVELSTRHSRITWQHCIYSQRKQVPSRVEDFSLSPVQPSNGARLQWKSPECNGSPYISHYVLSYCSIDSNSGHCTSARQSINISNQATSHVIGELKAGTNYSFTIRAVSQGIVGPVSPSVTHLVESGSNGVTIIAAMCVVTVCLITVLVLVIYRYRKQLCSLIPIATPKPIPGPVTREGNDIPLLSFPTQECHDSPSCPLLISGNRHGRGYEVTNDPCTSGFHQDKKYETIQENFAGNTHQSSAGDAPILYLTNGTNKAIHGTSEVSDANSQDQGLASYSKVTHADVLHGSDQVRACNGFPLGNTDTDTAQHPEYTTNTVKEVVNTCDQSTDTTHLAAEHVVTYSKVTLSSNGALLHPDYTPNGGV